ncbi:uncharacterized protein DDB_G0283697-like [Papaver somniferum]|uniref:uncharacterized protein DDB_G0283697-like n=1 Tax=Papaver somniferum TaxID=3469 RepID=UPI000E6F5E43|nr:uncharacterized protein DDB_G0283697-like [Papaver somniferum]
MDEKPTKTCLQKSKAKKSVTADDVPEADEKGESDSEQPLKEMKMKAKHDAVKRKEGSVLNCITSYFSMTSFLPANDNNIEDGKEETDGDQQQKEARTNVKHDTSKKKKKVSEDPEATTPSRKSQRLKDQVSPSSPKPEAEKKTMSKKKDVSDRQAEEQLTANTSASRVQPTKRKKKAEKAAPKEVLDDDTENEDDTDDFEKVAPKEAGKICL